MKIRQKFIYSYFLLPMSVAQGHEASELSAVEVRAKFENLLGLAQTGSEGVVSSQRLSAAPILRPGEVLEMVPGLIVTQHAGDGKANQYFLRGFNLDHGTDFATTVSGVPVNMPSHAHGQGYTDLNFLIPELVDRIVFRKGPYYAEEGDFASAGSAQIDYFRRLDSSLAQMTVGRNGYARTLLAGSPQMSGGNWLYGLEFFHNDGPWQVDEHYRKLNGVLRFSQGTRHDGWSLTGMTYQGQWTSTDQIAQRAIDRAAVDRFGTLDSTTGGRTFRYSLSGDWAARDENSQRKANVWWLKSGLDLWSNFQYCLNDIAASGGCATGDQFKQGERRQAGGFSLAQTVFDRWGAFEVSNALGLQGRVDRLSPVGLYNTRQREVWNTVREDRITQRSLAFWAQNEVQWVPWFRSVQGVRADAYDFAVDADLAANSGKSGDQMVTPKLSLVFGPWKKSELYANYGHGFHSNDARGTTITRDPASGDAVSRVKPLVRTKGYELGLRSEIVSGWQSTVALWQLEAASELLFVGDAGTTEASRPSRRRGIEWTNFYRPTDWLAFDGDFSVSQAGFTNPDAAGRHIPGAVSKTANVGVTLDHLGAWFGAMRWRYIGSRPLVEDNTVRAGPSSMTNLRIGYKYDRQTQLTLDVFNLFDRKVNDIEYWYESQLAGEAAPVFDRHVHPAEPRSLRASILYRF